MTSISTTTRTLCAAGSARRIAVALAAAALLSAAPARAATANVVGIVRNSASTAVAPSSQVFTTPAASTGANKIDMITLAYDGTAAAWIATVALNIS